MHDQIGQNQLGGQTTVLATTEFIRSRLKKYGLDILEKYPQKTMQEIVQDVEDPNWLAEIITESFSAIPEIDRRKPGIRSLRQSLSTARNLLVPICFRQGLQSLEDFLFDDIMSKIDEFLDTGVDRGRERMFLQNVLEETRDRASNAANDALAKHGIHYSIPFLRAAVELLDLMFSEDNHAAGMYIEEFTSSFTKAISCIYYLIRGNSSTDVMQFFLDVDVRNLEVCDCYRQLILYSQLYSQVNDYGQVGSFDNDTYREPQPTATSMVAALRDQGHAIAIWEKEELGQANPRRLEERLVELGQEIISDLQISDD